jgi:hypothetical protein
MLIGRPPFEGGTLIELAYRHVHEPPRPPTQVADGVPPALEALILRALAKDPAARFADADEMLRELDRLDLGAAASAAVLVPPPRAAETGDLATRRLEPALAAASPVADAGPGSARPVQLATPALGATTAWLRGWLARDRPRRVALPAVIGVLVVGGLLGGPGGISRLGWPSPGGANPTPTPASGGVVLGEAVAPPANRALTPPPGGTPSPFGSIAGPPPTPGDGGPTPRPGTPTTVPASGVPPSPFPPAAGSAGSAPASGRPRAPAAPAPGASGPASGSGPASASPTAPATAAAAPTPTSGAPAPTPQPVAPAPWRGLRPVPAGPAPPAAPTPATAPPPATSQPPAPPTEPPPTEPPPTAPPAAATAGATAAPTAPPATPGPVSEPSPPAPPATAPPSAAPSPGSTPPPPAAASDPTPPAAATAGPGPAAPAPTSQAG